MLHPPAAPWAANRNKVTVSAVVGASASVLVGTIIGSRSALDTATVYLLLSLLVLCSGLFSGLTLGLLGLSCEQLETIIFSDPRSTRAMHAQKILPLRRDAHLLLCTLLLGNVAVNALIAIMLEGLTGGTLGFLVSTTIIVIFGEVLPQATCSHHALAIGARAVPLTKAATVLMYPIAKPLSMVLDSFLGKEVPDIQSRPELTEWVRLHCDHRVLTDAEGGVCTRLLESGRHDVATIMKRTDQLQMIDALAELTAETIASLYATGFSHIPVYLGSRDNIIGFLALKDLLVLEGEKRFVDVLKRRKGMITKVLPSMGLIDLLSKFAEDGTRLAIVEAPLRSSQKGAGALRSVGMVSLHDLQRALVLPHASPGSGEDRVEVIDGSDARRANARERRLSSVGVDASLFSTSLFQSGM